jgi:alpha-glucan,water dikinase
VLTPDAPDVLSHVSVRARNMKVLFATCHEEEPLAQIKKAAGSWLAFKTTAAGAVTWTAAAPPAAGGDQGGHSSAHRPANLTISIPRWCGKWVVDMDAYGPSTVGAGRQRLPRAGGAAPAPQAHPAATCR